MQRRRQERRKDDNVDKEDSEKEDEAPASGHVRDTFCRVGCLSAEPPEKSGKPSWAFEGL